MLPASPSSLFQVTPLAISSAILLALSACGGGGGGGSDSVSFTETTPGGEEVVEVELCTGSEINSDRLFLQQVGATRAIIKWRGNADGGDEATTICFGTNQSALPLTSETDATVTATDHSEVLLTDLTPDTTYYYSVGGAGNAQDLRHFRTAPLTGQLPSDGNVRIWVLGDAGTTGSTIEPADGDLRDVRDGYQSYVDANGGEPTDLILMLGDVAYLDGTDAQFQASVFDVFPEILSNAALWNTIGNHEMGSSGLSVSTSTALYVPAQGTSDALPDSPTPYLNIHSFPTQGENGGEPSNTEQYYSFDYGNVHVVSLDSQVSIRDSGNNETMKQWLIADLAANNTDWTIVIFHHPPYTKGSHDSDDSLLGVDQPIFDMREQYTEIFEDYGVDLAYSGHSHSYERSFYINGHTGLEATFDVATHAENDGSGNALNGQGEQRYHQVSEDSGVDDKVVYTVAGSSGQVGGSAGSYPHDAMAHSELLLGSVIIDASRDELIARFIGVNGDVIDHFAVERF